MYLLHFQNYSRTNFIKNVQGKDIIEKEQKENVHIEEGILTFTTSTLDAFISMCLEKL